MEVGGELIMGFSEITRDEPPLRDGREEEDED